MKKELLDFSCQ